MACDMPARLLRKMRASCIKCHPAIGGLRVGLVRLFEEASMAQTTPVDIVRQASTLSILWGVLLIVFGVVAIGSPLLAAVAVNAVIAWLIVLAGVVHVIDR